MGHALYIRDLDDLKYFKKNTFSIIYFGTEFCEKLIPSEKEVREILKFARKHNVALTFVTPYCTDYGIKALREILTLFLPKTEIVFNDFGVLKLIKDNRLIPVLGRLLVAVKRDPRYKINLRWVDYFRTTNLNYSAFQNFLTQQGIFRVEIDNVIQGYTFKLPGSLRTSLYYPFVYITTARKCIMAHCDSLNSDDRVYRGDCSFECSKYTFLADLPGSRFKIILKGNSQFYRNEKNLKSLIGLNVDRLVFTPKLPFGPSRNCYISNV